MLACLVQKLTPIQSSFRPGPARPRIYPSLPLAGPSPPSSVRGSEPQLPPQLALGASSSSSRSSPLLLVGEEVDFSLPSIYWGRQGFSDRIRRYMARVLVRSAMAGMKRAIGGDCGGAQSIRCLSSAAKVFLFSLHTHIHTQQQKGKKHFLFAL